MKHLQNSKGFTLIELMIVVVIIGILAAIAIPRFTSFGDDARISEGEQLLRSVHTHQEMYRARAGSYGTWEQLGTIGWDPTGDGETVDQGPESNYFDFGDPVLTGNNEYSVTATGTFGDNPVLRIDQTGQISRDS